MAKKIAKDLPFNSDAERACLGSTFLSKDALLDVINSLNEQDFYEARHQIIFRCIRALFERNIPVEVLTVTEELMNIKELENVGGVEYLKECSDSMVALSSLEYYISIVSNQSVLRNFLLSIRKIDDEYKNEEIEEIDDFILKAKTDIDKVLERRRISNFVLTKDVVKKVQDDISHMADFSNEDGVIGLTTGYDNINHYTQGFKNGEMIIVAARPNVGKTALCMNFAHRAAIRGKKAVAIFSLEMSKELLVQRLMAISSCVNLSKITTGHLSGQDKMKLASASDELSEAHIYIDDTAGAKLTDIITKAKKLQAHEPNLGLIIIDYLGLVQTSQNSRNPDSRQEEVRKISLALKQLAREMKLPIVVVSQLSRDVEKRGGDNRPMMSDLRDSGSLEQDADIIMLLYREDYYKKNNDSGAIGFKKGGQLSGQDKYELAKAKKEKELGEQMPGNASYVEVNIAKNRNGSTGRCALFFYRDYGRFDQPSQEWEEAMREITADNIVRD